MYIFLAFVMLSSVFSVTVFSTNTPSGLAASWIDHGVELIAAIRSRSNF